MKRFKVVLLLLALLGGQSGQILAQEGMAPTEPGTSCFQVDYLKNGFRFAVRQTTDTIVLHSAYNARGGDPHSVERLLTTFSNLRVSAHYLIDRSGCVHMLVSDQYVSYHSGVSRMPDGRTSVNQFSVGIELLYTEQETPNDAQYEALRGLIATLKSKYPIRHIVGHGQVAPERRSDPWNFDWRRIEPVT